MDVTTLQAAHWRINALLGRLRRLKQKVADYDEIHQAELDRLNAARERALGPTLRRIDRLERGVKAFAVAAFHDFGEISHQLPNGEIRSTVVKTKLDKDDEKIATEDWGLNLLQHAGGITMHPQVDMKVMRRWLDDRVAAGEIVRMVTWGPADDPYFEVVDEKVGYWRPFPEGATGVFFWSEEGSAEFGFDHGEILEGVTWSPNGTNSSGRNFRIEL